MALIPLIIESEGLTGCGYNRRRRKNHLVNQVTDDRPRPATKTGSGPGKLKLEVRKFQQT
jgi:hypothetical protein